MQPIIIKLRNIFDELEEHKKKKIKRLSDDSEIKEFSDSIISRPKLERIKKGL